MGQNVLGRVVRGATCPWGELSLGQVVHGASWPWGELSMGRNDSGASRRKLSSGELSGNPKIPRQYIGMAFDCQVNCKTSNLADLHGCQL
jgi:hypothetical protein